MLKNRIVYGVVFLAAWIFFLCFNGYFSHFVLLVVLLLPMVSLCLGLLCARRLSLDLTLGLHTAEKGRSVPLCLSVRGRLPIPTGRGLLRIVILNRLTGDAQTERIAFTAGPGSFTLQYPLTSPTCGQVIVRLTQAKLCDHLGLFRLPLRVSEEMREQSVLFYPTAADTPLTVEQSELPETESERYSQTKPGDDPSELFAFREYREGDRPSRIHWKLSQKSGELLVKELGMPISDNVLFLLEPGSSGTEADLLLDAFATLSAFLCRQGVPHRLGFRAGKNADLTLLSLADPEDARPALDALLLADVIGGDFIPYRPEELPTGAAHLILLAARPVRAMADALRARLPNARFSLITTPAGEAAALTMVSPGELTVLHPEQIAEDLYGFRL